MKWYNKEISPKTSNIIGFGLLSVLLIVCFIQDRNERQKLYACSTYTIGEIARVHTLRGQTYVAYHYKINAKTVEADDNVTNFDTNEPWTVDMNKLSKRRLLIRVYCNDINVHRIVWDVAVPDTLRNIPAQGWNYIPFNNTN